jgi:hypothetical protein
LKANDGPGVYLFNRAGYYYMGRLLDGQSFDSIKTYPSKSNPHLIYRFGYAGGNVRSCLWIGPEAGEESASEYLTAPVAQVLTKCRRKINGKDRVDWLKNRKNIGENFNCPHNDARGPMKTKLKEAAGFYYNLEWDSKYRGGKAVDKAGELPEDTPIGYRFTTRDGDKAIVFHPKLGWGFVLANKVDLPLKDGEIPKEKKRWSLTEDLDKEYKCGENVDR